MKISGVNLNSETGGIILRIMFACATLVLIGIAIDSVLHNYQQSGQEEHRKALAISEYGLLVALQKITEHPSWRDGFEKTVYEDGWYRVEVRQNQNGDSLLLTIISHGGIGGVVETRECALMLDTSEGDSTWVRTSIQ
ncbi:MAG: hypothetical protein GX640_16465 [Fibrobacter sp.]|mgnify:CR=1 FL=1|nr:hypothetical protein [Fibrobacter sp.]